MPVPVEPRHKVIQKIGTKINSVVVPELIFEHSTDRQLLIVECKLKDISLDVNDRDNRQAFGYLCLNDSDLSRYLGITRSSNSKLLYSVDREHIEAYCQVLSDISEIITETNFSYFPYEVSGISVDDSEITLLFKDETGHYKEICVAKESLPFIIPLDPEVNLKDEYGRQVVEENLRMIIAARICPYIEFADINFSIEEICKELIPIWDLWAKTPRTKVKELIKYYMSGIVKELKKRGCSVMYESGEYKLNKSDQKIAEKVRSYFRTGAPDDLAQESVRILDQMVLDELMEEDI
ncbi:hypothetical protein [Paenibacillus lautus]|uniref:hypothetical protein n=1 Tax=Paenibacillus lautus TaxID=1401 RepID=UPI003987EBE7